MTVVLDFMAARAVSQARLLEHVLHDRGPWSIKVGDVEVPAPRVVTPSRVVFLAYFDHVPPGDVTSVSLHCREVMVSARGDLHIPESGAFNIEWSVGGAAPREAQALAGM